MIAHVLHSKHWHIRLLQGITAAYVIAFTAYAVSIHNYEFLFYLVYLLGYVFIMPFLYRHIHMPIPLMFATSVFMFLHVSGGLIYLEGVRLYDVEILPFMGAHYDNLVHTCGGFLSCLVAYTAYRAHLDEYVTHHIVTMGIFLVTYAGGMGVYNELIELFSVVYLNAGVAVGDYMNNAIDLLCNTMGSLVGVLFVWWYYRRYLAK